LPSPPTYLRIEVVMWPISNCTLYTHEDEDTDRARTGDMSGAGSETNISSIHSHPRAPHITLHPLPKDPETHLSSLHFGHTQCECLAILCVCVYVCVHVCMHVCMHACMQVYMHVVCTHACMYVRYTHKNTHSLFLSHTHTYVYRGLGHLLISRLAAACESEESDGKRVVRQTMFAIAVSSNCSQ
jgi:hypothetical protein